MAAWAATGAAAAPASRSAVLLSRTRAQQSSSSSISSSGGELARIGRFSVCKPSVGDVHVLRHLEREFVLDHFRLFQDEDWHKCMGPDDWCGLVNVIAEDGKAHQAIHNIIAGRMKWHETLQCIRTESPARGAGGSALGGAAAGAAAAGGDTKVVGYIHVVYLRQKACLDISHLKVDGRFRRHGLGSLLLAGAARRALQLGWKITSAELVVVIRNEAAVSLYRKLGFSETGATEKPISMGSGKVSWKKMARRFESIEVFARQCEERALASLHKPRIDLT